MFATTSRGVLLIPHLETLLGASCVHVGKDQGVPRGVDAVVGWGLKPSADVSEQWASERDIPFFRIEDGFLRSLGFGQSEPTYSMIMDDLGLHIDATRPSRFELLVRYAIDGAATQRARDLAALWRECQVSKYNQARDFPGPFPERYVLVIDQTFGDASIRFGQADTASFSRMLEAALDENPGSHILLKVHPEVVGGRKKGHFDLAEIRSNDRVRIFSEDYHAVGLIRHAEAIYTVSSQMGFEGLLWEKPVRTFGMPFYAGWGFTRDDLPPPDRRVPAPFEHLVHAALVAYPRYLHPETEQRCETEDLIEWMGLQRQMRTRFEPKIYATGFSPWKYFILEDFTQGSEVAHVANTNTAPVGSTLTAWASRHSREQETASFLRVEDGFIRSVGLGAELVRPLSWVFDRSGIYYDATRPSDLESIFEREQFSAKILARAKNLRDRIVREKQTKYNVGQSTWCRPPQAGKVLLVTGQVETDASIRFGTSDICTNLDLLKRIRTDYPGAYVVYKPHPDVVAGLRDPGSAESEARNWCDEIVADCSIADLFALVDEVHVLTSLSGFEALLRGKTVFTYGQPFFSGWGLTNDQCPLPAVMERRTRRLTIDELVAGTLILYPTYISRTTGLYTSPERILDEIAEWRAQAALPQTFFAKMERRIMRLFSR